MLSFDCYDLLEDFLLLGMSSSSDNVRETGLNLILISCFGVSWLSCGWFELYCLLEDYIILSDLWDLLYDLYLSEVSSLSGNDLDTGLKLIVSIILFDFSLL